MVTSPPTRRPITELATRTRLPGRRSKAAREGNRGEVGSPVSGRYGDYMSERLSRAIWFFLFFFFLFPCKIHSFVRPEESPILSPRPLRPPGARRARSSRTAR